MGHQHSIEWVEVVWSIVASASLTLATVHLMIWFQKRTAWANLFFALTATGMTGLLFCELWMLHARTPAEFGRALRYTHVPMWVILISLIGFVRIYMRAGRAWLAWSACGLRTVGLLLNFLFTPNIIFRQITALRPVQFLGESVPVPVGILNPWIVIFQLSVLCFLVFMADVTVTLWRRGERGLMVLLSSTLVVLTACRLSQSVWHFWEFTPAMLIFCVFFLAIVGMMAWELSWKHIHEAQLSDALRDNEQLLSSIYNTVEDIIFKLKVEPEGQYRFLSVNQSFSRITGLGHNQVVGKTVNEVIPEPSLTMVLDKYRQTIATKTILRWEEVTDYPTGRLTGEVSIAPVLDTKGVCTHLVGSVHDITARREGEEKLEQQRHELAHLSRISTLSELSSSLAHELNQPLMGIRGNAQAALRYLSRQNPDLEEIRKIFDDIVQDNRRASSVIVKLRELYKKAPYDFVSLDMNHVVGEVLSLVRSNTLLKKISVTTALDSTLPVMMGDKVQLQQVILNLVLNSFDAMESRPRGRKLRIRTAREEGTHIVISLEDNGSGIDEQARARLFTPFFTTKENGMGMGLVISKTIVESHGGTIWADAQPGPGAVFHFRLPISKEKPR